MTVSAGIVSKLALAISPSLSTTSKSLYLFFYFQLEQIIKKYIGYKFIPSPKFYRRLNNIYKYAVIIQTLMGAL